MFRDNLIQMRKIHQMTQEDVAEKVGVSRQAVAKWESGDTVPDLDKCKILADLFGVSLDDLANYESKNARFWRTCSGYLSTIWQITSPKTIWALASPPKESTCSGW